MPGYHFISEPTLSNAGGVGFYIRVHLNFTIQTDLTVTNLDFEVYFAQFTLLTHSSFTHSLLYCTVYFTYTAHVQLLAKNMAATHVHICIRIQTNTLRFCREDNPLYVFTL